MQNALIAIVDGGSTKCDWVLLNELYQEVGRTTTPGLNPNVLEGNRINDILLKHNELNALANRVVEIYFYGSGCSTESNQNILTKELHRYFPNLKKSRVREDMLAAAYAVYTGDPVMVGILGTGSNVCFFDGKNIRIDIPSIGYLFGDDGGGSALGKRLLKAFFMKKFPHELKNAFDLRYGLDIQGLYSQIYKNEKVSANLASYNAFILEYRQHPFIQNLLETEFSEFFFQQVMAYPEATSTGISFVGSIAHFYPEELCRAAKHFNIPIHHIVQRPIDALVDYHRNYILTSNE